MRFMSVVLATLSVLFSGAANANSIILDGTFQGGIAIGYSGSYAWNDWTNAGITTQSAAGYGLSGNYARLPNSPNGGSDLFQRFNALQNGEYTLSFSVLNQSQWSAELVLAVQQALGTAIPTVFAAGTAEELNLAPSSAFIPETLTFTINNPSFTPNELYFSNSYDAPVDQISNSINPSGTIIDIADVSLTAGPPSVTPLPSTWILLLSGIMGLGFVVHRAKKRQFALMAARSEL